VRVWYATVGTSQGRIEKEAKVSNPRGGKGAHCGYRRVIERAEEAARAPGLSLESEIPLGPAALAWAMG
jgi:hypothetical protein